MRELSVETRTDRDRYSAGKEVGISVTVENNGLNPVELVFTSAQRYDFIVLRRGVEMWRWSDGKVFATELDQLRLGPGERRSYTGSWETGGVEPGEYTVTGVVASEPLLKDVTTFRVDG